jgi:diguanylate cyclase (GGDEF)-like protein
MPLLPRLNSRRYQRVFVACLATLAISAGLAGVLLVVRWKTDRALRGDTHLVLRQAGQQLVRAIQSRRGTLTLMRDAFDRAPGLSSTDQSAIAHSAVAHTRHLVGMGLLQRSGPTTWWVAPAEGDALAHLDRMINRRASVASAWRVPSTFTVQRTDDHWQLVMLEPLRRADNRGRAIIGVFDIRPMIADFFELTLQQPYPVRVLQTPDVLYASDGWHNDAEASTLVIRPVTVDALQWVLQMQPGTTQVVKTMTSFQGLLEVFTVVAGVSSIGLIWLLAMRTWILERTVRRRTSALRRTTERLRQLAITDELTGLYNRRFFQERWQWEVKRALRYDRPLACLMIDVNHFKRVNDQLGHHAGDQLLRQVAEELRTTLRQSDILARFGGDEFVVALPETPVEQARVVAEKLRALAVHGLWSERSDLGPVRLSVGLGMVEPRQAPDDALRQADDDLYTWKRARTDTARLPSEPAASPSR